MSDATIQDIPEGQGPDHEVPSHITCPLQHLSVELLQRGALEALYEALQGSTRLYKALQGSTMNALPPMLYKALQGSSRLYIIRDSRAPSAKLLGVQGIKEKYMEGLKD